SNKVNAVGSILPTIGQNSSNNINPFSADGPSNTTASPTQGKSLFIYASQLPDDLNMPELEDIIYSDDEDDVGAEAIFNSLESSITDKIVIDSGCSRHIKGNMTYLSDFEELNGGYVSFGGNPKGGKISGKGKIKTENQLSLKVKVIRSDNGTEFKNSNLNQFCGIKGIKRKFSVPRTPQQNSIAERKNRTLIEAARTMLADSLLPILFWAEAVNTACYVQNK
nr:putative ribonuclease H-like domain-containing protein [Tanacetum cinerariifolium]